MHAPGPDLTVATELHLPARADAPARARAAARDVLASAVPKVIIDDVVLVVSELVSNGVMHAGLTEAEEIEVRLWTGGRIRVEVRDHGRGIDRAQKPGTPRIGGRGLGLVSVLSSRWGIVEGDGVLAWAEIALPTQ